MSTDTVHAASNLNDELTLILNQAVLSLDLLPAGHPARAGLIELEHSVLRCAGISRRLLSSTRNGPVPAPRRYSGNRYENPGDRIVVR